MFMATARIDAIWVHDGFLDARDYKTGRQVHRRRRRHPRGPCAGVRAGGAGAGRGLRLRLRYEYLRPEVDEDPEPTSPTTSRWPIDEELRAAVARSGRSDDWHGVGDVAVCGQCRFRSICPDSAAAGEPGWPVLSTDRGDRDP